MLGLLGWLSLILGGFIVSTGIPLWLNEVAETSGDDALLWARTLLVVALLGLGGLTLAGIGACLLAFA